MLGRVDPIPFQMKSDSTGVGKINQDVRMIETTVSQRRELDSERQHKETEDQRRARQVCISVLSLHDRQYVCCLTGRRCTPFSSRKRALRYPQVLLLQSLR